MGSDSRTRRLVALLILGFAPALAPAGDIHAFVRNSDGDPLADAVVVATPAGGTANLPPRHSPPAVEDQRNKEFVPYVLPILVGTAVQFPNHDNIRHHVYSFSPAKTFELPLYAGTPAEPVVFDKPGVVILGCNIHDWMVAYIYVSESPYFAKTGDDGKATLTGLPAGEYSVRVWHPLLKGQEQETAQTLAVPATGAVEIVREIALKPDFRLRRAPIPGRGGY